MAASTISALARVCDLGDDRDPVLPGRRIHRLPRSSGWPWPPRAAAARPATSRELTGDIAADDDLDKVVAKIAFADARAVEETAQQLDLDVAARR